MAMADTLTTLVRLSKHKVEKAQEALGAAQQKALEIAQWLQSAEASRAQALTAVLSVDDVASRLDATHYDARLKQMVEKLKKDLMAAEEVVTEKRAALALVYAEQERYSLLLAQEELKIAKRRAAKHQDVLDEVAGQGFFRRERAE